MHNYLPNMLCISSILETYDYASEAAELTSILEELCSKIGHKAKFDKLSQAWKVNSKFLSIFSFSFSFSFFFFFVLFFFLFFCFGFVYCLLVIILKYWRRFRNNTNRGCYRCLATRADGATREFQSSHHHINQCIIPIQTQPSALPLLRNNLHSPLSHTSQALSLLPPLSHPPATRERKNNRESKLHPHLSMYYCTIPQTRTSQPIIPLCISSPPQIPKHNQTRFCFPSIW
jgi:hypothetical protein